MLPRRWIATIALACLSTLSITSAHAATSTRITAVGDSYMAGIGAGNYTTADGCRRSSSSYAALLARADSAPFTDLSCPGATTTQALTQAAQVPSDSHLVLVQIGGNDVGFGDVAGACTIAGTSGCDAALARGEQIALSLPAKIAPIIAEISRRAPNATIVLAGYPSLLQGQRACAGTSVGQLLGPDRTAGLVHLQNSLDRALRATARQTGVRFHDWPPVVNQHSLCSTSPWYVIPFGGDWADLLHPTAPAYQAYAAVLGRSQLAR